MMFKNYLSIFCLLVAILVAPTAFAQVESIEPTNLSAKDQWILTALSAESKEKAVEAIDNVSPNNLEIKDVALGAILVGREGIQKFAEFIPSDEVEDLCAALRREARREIQNGAKWVRRFSCSENPQVQALKTPNDPYYSILWGMEQSNDIDMNMSSAWNMSTGSNSTVVGIIDTGIDYNHPDLAANMWSNPWEIPGNGVDDDKNGYVDDVYGINAITNSGNPMDDQGHGTHVAGTIGAAGNNSVGVAGVNWNVKMFAAKFLDSSGNGNLFDAIKAVDYITSMKLKGVNIVASNNSWGGGGYIQTMYDAISRARNAGVLFIAAAGNNSNNNDSNPSYPANYAIDNVISVAAVDSNGNLASFSNYGATTVKVAAPGVNIGSTYPGNRYVYLSGTSMACPHVTGLAALIKSYANNASWSQIRDIILQTGLSLPSLNGVVATGKIVKADAALTLAYNSNLVGPTPTPTNTPTPQPTSTPTPRPTSTPTPMPTPTFAPGYSNINLTVMANGAPVSEAKVIYRTSSGAQKIGYTGPDGKISFYNLARPVNYTIDIVKSGYTFTQYSAELRDTLNLTLYGSSKTYQLRIYVTDEKQSPIQGATIAAGALGTFSTDSQGLANIDVSYGQNYNLTISKDGYVILGDEISGTIMGEVMRRVAGYVGNN